MIKYKFSNKFYNIFYGALPLLQKKKLFYFLIFVILFICWNSTAFASARFSEYSHEFPNYYNIFTKEIYDQEEILASSSRLSSQAIDERCTQSLREKKKQQLEKRLIEKIRKELKHMIDECDNDEKRIFWDSLLGNISELPLALIRCRCPQEIGFVMGDILAKIGRSVIVSKYYDSPIVAQLKHRIKSIEDEINYLYDNLDFEKIATYEKQYIQKKRFFTSCNPM